MALTFATKGGGGDFKTVSSGTHIAVCNLVADLGVQPGSGMFPTPKRQVYIRFEVPAERVDYEKDGQKLNGPIVIGQFFTASMHEKSNLRKQLEGWRGKKFTDEEASIFDVSTILGKGCMLSVVENVKGDKTYSNIAAIINLPKGTAAPKAENPLLYYAEDDTRSLNFLPPWIQEKIAKQIMPEVVVPESRGSYGYDNDPGITDADLPESMLDNSEIPF